MRGTPLRQDIPSPIPRTVSTAPFLQVRLAEVYQTRVDADLLTSAHSADPSSEGVPEQGGGLAQPDPRARPHHPALHERVAQVHSLRWGARRWKNLHVTATQTTPRPPLVLICGFNCAVISWWVTLVRGSSVEPLALRGLPLMLRRWRTAAKLNLFVLSQNRRIKTQNQKISAQHLWPR